VLCELEDATGITPQDLTNFDPDMDNPRLRLQWTSRRRTTEPEDIAYSPFGIFNAYPPIIPGESAENVLGCLLGEIISQSENISVLSWVGEASPFCGSGNSTVVSLPSSLHTSLNPMRRHLYLPMSFRYHRRTLHLMK